MNFERFFTEENETSPLSSVSNAVKDVKVELKRLEKIEKRKKIVDDLFAQIALASRLKVELQICCSQRSPPIVCQTQFRLLSCGKCLILVNLRNDCKQNLNGWQLIVQCQSFFGQNMTHSKNLNFTENVRSTNTFCQIIPSLSDGCAVDLDVYCPNSLQLPTFVKCFLAKSFTYKHPKTKEMKSKTFQIFVHSELLSVLDLVRPKIESTLVPFQQKYDSDKIGIEEMKFCFSLAILKCLGKEQYDENFRKNSEFLLSWIFPNAKNVLSEGEDGSKIRFTNMNVDSNHLLSVTFQNSSKNNEIQMNLEVTGCESEKVAQTMKFFILAKYLRFVNDCLRVAKTVDINLSSISFALEQIEHGETQENVINFLNHLTENVLWKLPLV